MGSGGVIEGIQQPLSSLRSRGEPGRSPEAVAIAIAAAEANDANIDVALGVIGRKHALYSREYLLEAATVRVIDPAAIDEGLSVPIRLEEHRIGEVECHEDVGSSRLLGKAGRIAGGNWRIVLDPDHEAATGIAEVDGVAIEVGDFQHTSEVDSGVSHQGIEVVVSCQRAVMVQRPQQGEGIATTRGNRQAEDRVTTLAGVGSQHTTRHRIEEWFATRSKTWVGTTHHRIDVAGDQRNRARAIGAEAYQRQQRSFATGGYQRLAEFLVALVWSRFGCIQNRELVFVDQILPLHLHVDIVEVVIAADMNIFPVLVTGSSVVLHMRSVSGVEQGVVE